MPKAPQFARKEVIRRSRQFSNAFPFPMIGRWRSDGTSGTPHSELGDFSDVGVVGHEPFLAAFPLENKVHF